jgi:hypothetical protein
MNPALRIPDHIAAEICVMPLDEYENALIQYLKRCACTPPKLADLLTIWGWRNAVSPEIIPLSHLAECMWAIVARYDLFGCSNTIPMIRGPLGIYADAAPDRVWMFSLDLGSVPIRQVTPERDHWCRLIAVLASRLMMAEVSKLLGYDHQANLGPFGVKGEVVTP